MNEQIEAMLNAPLLSQGGKHNKLNLNHNPDHKLALTVMSKL